MTKQLGERLRVKDETLGQMANDMAAAQAQIKALREALDNCRLFAARRRAEEWATHILRFCESGGSVANPLRQDDSALQAALKAERERCAVTCDRKKKEFAEAFKDMADESLGAGQCAAAIRAMEDQ